MRRFCVCMCLVLFLSCLFAPTAIYAKGGPAMPSPPRKGTYTSSVTQKLNVASFLALLKEAIALYRAGGGGEPLPEPLP